jgi:alanine racemase
MPQRALARVNLAAIERNARRLRERAEGAMLCAVVKADGYGHGAVPAARAAQAAGAQWLAVATAAEAAALRAEAIEGRILVMGALSAEELPIALEARADIVVWSERFVDLVRRLASEDAPALLHVKYDTGMGRLGTRELDEALAVARHILELGRGLELVGAMTHFATADEDPDFMTQQLERFRPFVAAMRELSGDLVVHAANSAATLREPETHFDMVRCGIALYGLDPMNRNPDLHGLEPALELCSYLAAVKVAAAGESAGYGRTWAAEHETWVGTVPIGYADGIRRALGNRAELLVGGCRYPLVGTVSMDNVTIDLGEAPTGQVGEVVTIIGRSGALRQTAEDLAERLETINYEVVCGISARVPRAYHRDGEPA